MNQLKQAAKSSGLNPRYWAWLQCGGKEDRSTRLRSTQTNAAFLTWVNKQAQEFRHETNVYRYDSINHNDFDAWLMQFVEQHQKEHTNA